MKRGRVRWMVLASWVITLFLSIFLHPLFGFLVVGVFAVSAGLKYRVRFFMWVFGGAGNELPNVFRVALGVLGGIVSAQTNWLLPLSPSDMIPYWMGLMIMSLGFFLNDEPIRRLWRKAGLITFSGIDGTGKSTMISKLVERFRQKDIYPEVYRFNRYILFGRTGLLKRSAPITSKKPVARRSPMSFLRAYLGVLDNMLQAFLLLPKIWRGKVVICDRFVWDNYVKHKALGYPTRFLKWLVILLKPQYGFILDATPQTSRQRTDQRSFHLEYEHQVLEDERESFRWIGHRLGFTICDTTQASPEQTFQEIIEVIR